MMKRLVNNQLTIIGAKDCIEIYNMAGMMLHQTAPTSHETVINVGTLPSGLYIAKCGNVSFKFTKK